MIYVSQGPLIIRNIKESDIQAITEAEIEQGWDADPEKYRTRFRDHQSGKAIALVAEYDGKSVGYINVYPDSNWGAFRGKGYPEIIDFGVLEKYRGRGIGSALMDAAEKIAAEYGNVVYLGVGLHSGYGSAQRMYVKRGFVPDGSGVWYGDEICEPYKECKNDDHLILYFSKKLK